MFIDSGKVTSKWGKEPPVIKTREELEKDASREGWKNLIAKGWRRSEKDWTKKKDRATTILNSWSNNNKLLNNRDTSSKRFILLK